MQKKEVSSMIAMFVFMALFIPAVSADACSFCEFINISNITRGITDHGLLSNLSADSHPQYILTSGTRAFTGMQSLGGFNLTDLLDPVAPQDAATKNYVDSVNTSMQAYVDGKTGPDGTYFGGYTLPVMALTNSPADNATNYMGGRPVAPSTTAATNKIFIPTSGVLERAEIYDYSGTAGTGEAWSYYVRLNNANDVLIQTVSVSANERIFTNSAMNMNVAAGDYIEIKRKNPMWATNPLTNIVGGYVFINTTIHAPSGAGYTLPVMALTSSPVDSATVYFGNRPIAPSTTAATNKIYVPRAGTIKRAEIYCYSGTAGTAEPWTLYIRLNNAADTQIAMVSSATAERIFRNANVGLPVAEGDYVEIKGVQPAWATNPATTIYGGYLYIE